MFVPTPPDKLSSNSRIYRNAIACGSRWQPFALLGKLPQYISMYLRSSQCPTALLVLMLPSRQHTPSFHLSDPVPSFYASVSHIYPSPERSPLRVCKCQLTSVAFNLLVYVLGLRASRERVVDHAPNHGPPGLHTLYTSAPNCTAIFSGP